MSFSLSLGNRYTGKTIKAINLGSYNYLGFAEKSGPCATDAINAIKTFGIANCNTGVELGMSFMLTFSGGLEWSKDDKLINNSQYFSFISMATHLKARPGSFLWGHRVIAPCLLTIPNGLASA